MSSGWWGVGQRQSAACVPHTVPASYRTQRIARHPHSRSAQRGAARRAEHKAPTPKAAADRETKYKQLQTSETSLTSSNLVVSSRSMANQQTKRPSLLASPHPRLLLATPALFAPAYGPLVRRVCRKGPVVFALLGCL